MFRSITMLLSAAALAVAMTGSSTLAAEKTMDSAKKAACIEACTACLQACRECVTGCDCAMCEKDCLTCIETCQTCVALMQYESAHSPQMCGLYADVCEACAKACLECGDMPCCQACAQNLPAVRRDLPGNGWLGSDSSQLPRLSRESLASTCGGAGKPAPPFF